MKKLVALLPPIILIAILSLSASALLNRNFLSLNSQETKLPDQSLARVYQAGVLKVGTSLEELPWGALDKKTGKGLGAEVEIAELLGKTLGLKIELVNKGFDFLIPELLNQKFDVIIAGLSITLERQEKIEFSDPYFTTGQAVAVKSNNRDIETLADLKGKTVGTLSGTTSFDFAKQIPGIKEVRVYDEPGKYFSDTVNGAIDATVYDLPAVFWYTQNNSRLKIAIRELTSEKYGMGLRKEDVSLKFAINQAITKMKGNSEFQKIITRWYGP